MIYFYMQVLNNPLLNILLPQDNKALKDVLKQADTKTLEQMVNNKSVSVNDVLKNLFDELKTGTKSNSNIENILKNSTVFKDLGSFSNSLNTLLQNLDEGQEQSTLQKFKPLLESFLKDIKDIDVNNLKEQLSKSGVFLESKIAQGNNQKAISGALEKVLTQIQTLVKDLNLPQAKQINELVSKILQTPNNITEKQQTTNKNTQINDLKTLLNNLQSLSKSLSSSQTQNLSSLTNQLKSLINEGTLVESKLQNLQTQNPTISSQEQKPNLKTQEPIVQTQNQNSSNQANQKVENSTQMQTTQTNISNIKEQLNTQTKELLTQIKNEIVQNPNLQNKANIISQIDNLLKTNDLFSKNEKLIEPKALLNNLVNSNEIKNISTTNQNISNIVLNLKNISQNISTLENQALNLTNITSQKTEVLSDLKTSLANLKTELLNIKGIDTTNLNQIVSKLENTQNLFSKIEVPNTTLAQNIQNTNPNSFVSNFASNLNTLLLSLKDSISTLEPNQSNLNTQNQVLKTIDKIETILKENISNNQNNPNNTNLQNQLQTKSETSNISNDMKSVLLQMQDELSNKTDIKSQDMLRQVDRLLTQIDYHQLSSLASNSSYVYVPFFWEMLDEGTISMKKLNEEKFYCQINLSLKDFGKVDLMMALYDKNKLDLTIHAQREHFKVSLRENMKQLKQALNSVDLIPVNIKLLDMKEENTTKIASPKSVYDTNYDNINLGLNIKA